MSATNPRFQIARQSIQGEENEFVKMFDPRPTNGAVSIPGYVPQPEPLTPTNPVPEVMEAALLASVDAKFPHSHKHELLNGIDLPKWDGGPGSTKPDLHFFTINDAIINSPFNGGQYPAPTTRVPRGVVFHSRMQGKGPPPHTIHWHGIEPTPVNDGVGHCSQELGSTIYQWQPNFIGSYFYHCHRNTMQHFEFGLFGDLLIEPPDAYFASVVGSNFAAQTIPTPAVLNGIPIGACSDGKFRTAANLIDYNKSVPAAKKFDFRSGDPVFGVAGPNGVGVGHPHAWTVAYDVEAIWVMDDRDSRWSDIVQTDAFATFPAFGQTPGVDDSFHNNVGPSGFFAFNDFNADYWYVTGVPVPANLGGTGTIDPAGAPPTGGGLPGGVLPAALNSGKSGSQIAISASVGQTILVRCLDAAYNKIHVTFPVDVVIIAWDGRALGVPPFGLYNHAFVVPAGTPIETSTARRYDALIKATQAGSFTVKCEFFDTRGGDRLVTALIPMIITA